LGEEPPERAALTNKAAAVAAFTKNDTGRAGEPGVMTSGGSGVIVHASGNGLVPPADWQGPPDHGLSGQVHRNIFSGPGEWASATTTLLDEALGAQGELDHLNIVWWRTTSAADHADIIRSTIDTLSGVLAYRNLQAESADDLWPTTIDYDRGWHAVSGVDSLTVACTNEPNARLRIWYIASDASYIAPDGHPSISGLLEVDDTTGLPGALADYAAKLAATRQHLYTSAVRDARIIEPNPSKPMSSNELLELAGHVRWLNHAHQGLITAGHNLAYSREQLVQRINALAGKPGWPWRFAVDDAHQQDAASATTSFNVTRAEGIFTAERERRQHQDSIDNTKATRSNSYATLLLAVAAGALGTAQLASGRHHRVGVALLGGGLLLGIGLLVLDAAPYRYSRPQRILIATGVATAAVGIGAYQFWAATTCVAIGAAGAAVGFISAWLVDTVLHNARR
jgi:hypothetical protein